MDKLMFKNPLPIRGIGDPFLLAPKLSPWKGRWYLYATSSPRGFKVWSTEDLVEWKDEGLCYDGQDSAWAKDCFWAPECNELDGRYYLFFSANWKYNPQGDEETFRLGVAVADSPLGPFRDLHDRPLFDPGYPAIDADVFEDVDGARYVTWSRCCYKHRVGPYEESHIYGAKLKADLSGIEGEGICLLKPCQEWENASVHTGRRWNEGSFVFRHGETYYMFFSANHFQEKAYAVGYATAPHPLGPWTKSPANPLLAHDWPRVSGPGHNSCIPAPDGDGWLIVYHCHTDPYKGGGDRQVCIDRVRVRADGSLWTDGPTTNYRPAFVQN